MSKETEIKKLEKELERLKNEAGSDLKKEAVKAERLEKKEMKEIKKSEKTFLKNMKHEFRFFLNSFSSLGSLKALIVASFDVLFYILFIGAIIGVAFFLTWAANPLAATDPTGLLGNAEAIASYESMVRTVFVYVIAAVIMLAVSFIISYVISRAFVWTTLIKQKLDLKFMKRFTLLNLIWLPAWVLLFFILIQPVNIASKGDHSTFMFVYSLIIIILFIICSAYLTYILFYIFCHTHNVFHSLKSVFKIGARNISKLWIPVLLVIIMFLIVNIISLLFVYFPKFIFNTITALLMITFATWAKIYAVSLMDTHLKHQIKG